MSRQRSVPCRVARQLFPRSPSRVPAPRLRTPPGRPSATGCSLRSHGYLELLRYLTTLPTRICNPNLRIFFIAHMIVWAADTKVDGSRHNAIQQHVHICQLVFSTFFQDSRVPSTKRLWTVGSELSDTTCFVWNLRPRILGMHCLSSCFCCNLGVFGDHILLARLLSSAKVSVLATGRQKYAALLIRHVRTRLHGSSATVMVLISSITSSRDNKPCIHTDVATSDRDSIAANPTGGTQFAMFRSDLDQRVDKKRKYNKTQCALLRSL